MVQGTFIYRSEKHFQIGSFPPGHQLQLQLSYLEQRHTVSQGGDGLCLGKSGKPGLRRSLTFSKSLWTTISYLKKATTLWPALLATFDFQRGKEHIADSRTDR